LRCSRAEQRHGISRQLQRTASGSTPHDRVAVLQICSSCSLPLDQPRQGAPRYPLPAANRPTTCRARRHLPLIRQPLHRRTTCWTGSIQVSQLARGIQIPMASAARPYVPLSALSSLGGFRTPAAECAAPSLKRPASETLHKLRHCAKSASCPFIPQEQTSPGACRTSVSRQTQRSTVRWDYFNSPLKKRDAPAGITGRDVGELALEGCGERATVQPFTSAGAVVSAESRACIAPFTPGCPSKTTPAQGGCAGVAHCKRPIRGWGALETERHLSSTHNHVLFR
jgi:hypothetical protein